MSRIVRCSLIQARNLESPESSLEKIKRGMIEKHVSMIRQAAEAGSKVICLQEIFYGPYFCAEQSIRWYDFTEPVPDGPTIQQIITQASRDKGEVLTADLNLDMIAEVRKTWQFFCDRRRTCMRRW